MGSKRKYELNGEFLSCAEIADLSGLAPTLVWHRLKCGMSVLDILKTPVRHNRQTRVGDVYGELTILKDRGKDACRKQRWLCLCSCGKTVEVRQGDMRGGRTLSCGHIRSQRVVAKRLAAATDWSGTVLPWGTIIVRRANFKVAADGGSVALWLCMCPCGNEFVSVVSAVKNGARKRCSRSCRVTTLKQTA